MNADERLKQRELISALADGQLGDDELAEAIDLTAVDEDARACWHLYHLVGDVLRSPELGALGRNRDFLSRLSQQLQAGPVVHRVGAMASISPEIVAMNDHNALGRGQKDHEAPAAAANDGIFRWKLVAGFASLAAVAVIGWAVIAGVQDAPDSARLARSGTATDAAAAPMVLADAPTASSGAPVMIRDRRLDELMAAHRQIGGNSALQNPSGFLRNATFDGASR